MRNLIKTLMVLITVVSALTLKATDPILSSPVIKIVAEDNDHYRVMYKAGERQNVKVQLIDNNDQMVYQESFTSEAFAKRFDLSKLPAGDYTFKVVDAGKSYEETVKLGDVSGFTINLSPKSTKKIELVGSNPAGKEMTLFILDASKDVVYKESITSTDQVHKLYNLDKLYGDQISFVIYHRDQKIAEKNFTF